MQAPPDLASDVTSATAEQLRPRHFPEQPIPLMIVNALRKAPPVHADGRNIRDWFPLRQRPLSRIERILEDARGETRCTRQCERVNLDIVRTICRLIDEQFGSARRSSRAGSWSR
jgi:dTDP-glucose 4,6-dehydratase